jgi:type IV pilus assembly protein PilW
MRSTRRHAGLTLIELMVSMTIALLLLAGTASLFISNKRIYREQEELGRLQENARFALSMLIADIRMTAYAGCSDSIGNVDNRVDGGTDAMVLYSFVNGIEGSESAANWTPGSSTEQVGLIRAGTDGITTRYIDPMFYADGTEVNLTTDMGTDTGADLAVADTSGIAEGDLLAVSDCASTDVFEVTGLDATDVSHVETSSPDAPAGAPGNSSADLSKGYSTSAQLARFVARRYFVGTGALGGPSLFVTENYGDPEELIEGVENLQILYGEDTTADAIPDAYRTAAAVTNWSNVNSVRIALLMRTVEENVNNDVDTRTYSLLGTNVGPFNDQRRRRVFTTTVRVRNNG